MDKYVEFPSQIIKGKYKSVRVHKSGTVSIEPPKQQIVPGLYSSLRVSNRVLLLLTIYNVSLTKP